MACSMELETRTLIERLEIEVPSERVFMIASVIVLSSILLRQHVFNRPSHPPIQIGWHDEFCNLASWHALNMDNKAIIELASPGQLKLLLGQVPRDWPYAFQWSGIKQNIQADVAHFPVLMAYVGTVHGYAHLDVDVLDADNKPVKTLRSSTINTSTSSSVLPGYGHGSRLDSLPRIAAGVSVVDLGKELLPSVYNLQIRLIVGGDNSGCKTTYHWVRFVARKDWEWLAALPEFPFYESNTVAGGLPNSKAGPLWNEGAHRLEVDSVYCAS